MNATDDKLLPHDDEAERCVLGSILIEPAKLDDVRQIICPSDFFESKGPNRRTFAHMLGLHAEGQPVDLQLLVSRMKGAGDYDNTAGYVAELLQATPTAANAERYANIVKDCSLKRQGYIAVHDATQSLTNGKPAIDTISQTIAALDAIRRRADSHEATFEIFRPAELATMDLRTEFFIDGTLVAERWCRTLLLGEPRAGVPYLCNRLIAVALKCALP